MNIPVLTDILNANNLLAEQNRKILDEKKIYMINLLASPGAGKTTFIEKSIEYLKKDMSVAVIEGDLASDVDSQRIKKLDIPVVQINTGGGCHLNAVMIQKAFENLELDKINLIFIENVGNLVCPSGYNLGENMKLVMSSTPEGDDKVLKYPLIFQRSRAMVINKIDLIPYLDYEIERIKKDFFNINPEGTIFSLSGKTREGFEPFIDWIKGEIAGFRKE